jgi:hypothetical protein
MALSAADKFTVFGQVHALVSSDELGQAVVIESNNLIIPVAVSKNHRDVAKTLFKGDIVSVKIKTIKSPSRPPHFQTDADELTGITVVDPLVNCHGVDRAVTGHLVKFKKSPAISLDVYAVRIMDANGIGRNMTLFPDWPQDSPEFGEVFMAISAKAKAVWDAVKEEPGVVRNFHEKKTVRVVAKGKMNVVSTEQANAQVYLKSADDLELKVE